MKSLSKIKLDLALSLGSQFAFKLFGFGTIALLARHLSQDDYGRLALALSICTLGAFFTDLGYSTDSIRKIAAKPAITLKQLGKIISLRIPLLLAFFVLTNILVWFSKPDLLPITLGISIAAALKDLYRSYASVFIARRRITRNIVSFSIGLAVILLGAVCANVFDLNLLWVVSFYIAGSICMLAMVSAQIKHAFGTFTIDINKRDFNKFVFSALPLFALTGVNYAHFAIDNIALGYFRPYSDVATFSAAAQLLEASQFAIRPLSLIMFPVCALLCVEKNWTQMRETLSKMYGGAMAIGLLAWLVILALSTQIIDIVYSAKFEESAAILRLLYASVPGLFVTSVAIFVSASLNREKYSCAILCLGLSIKLLLFSAIVPTHGPIGVAWLNLFTQTLIALLLVIDSYRTISLRHSPNVNGAVSQT